MKLAGLLMFINDIHSLGLKTTQGMYLTDAWYWNQTPESRGLGVAGSSRSSAHAVVCRRGLLAVTQYLMAVKALVRMTPTQSWRQLKKQKIN